MFSIQHHRHGEIVVTPHVKRLYDIDQADKCDQRSDEWHARRRNKITASMVASVCGDNPYESRLSALKKKVGVEKAFQGNAATRHGTLLEPVAIEIYERMTNEKVLEFGLMNSLNSDEDYLAGSPDGITASGRLIEVKCPFRRKPTGVVPPHYVHQIQTLMHILHIAVCDFIEFVPGQTVEEDIFCVITVHRDDDFWARTKPKLRVFWDDVMDIRERPEKLQLLSKRKRTATVPADDPPVDDHEPPVDDHKPPVDLLDALLPPPRRARLDDGTDDGTDDDEGSANNFAVNADDCLIKIDT